MTALEDDVTTTLSISHHTANWKFTADHVLTHPSVNKNDSFLFGNFCSVCKKLSDEKVLRDDAENNFILQFVRYHHVAVRSGYK